MKGGSEGGEVCGIDQNVTVKLFYIPYKTTTAGPAVDNNQTSKGTLTSCSVKRMSV